MKKLAILLLLIFVIFFLHKCQTFKKPASSDRKLNTIQFVDLDASPVVSAQSAINLMKVEEGFEVRLVASEPLISAPVAMSFDNKGRIWVVEMNGYMPDTLATGEDRPTGKIVILEDTNKDGQADQRTVFLDSLKLPRALCFIENGILVAEPPYLWYYEIIADKPGKRILVDSKYAAEGNVEHQPNGLFRAMDNWIYNAKSAKRYRKTGDKWTIEKTHFRGQWGISQDDYGRLFYNDNSTNLRGDYFSPGLGAGNVNQQGVSGFSERIVLDNSVYPLRPTTGVNRGYEQGVLDDSLRLVNFTAACAPLIYRGSSFGAVYNLNAFVAEPSANLIKRNVLYENGYVINGKQAYKKKEFLASTDERFRPVNLYDGADGALYIVDMYRGIIQHKTYLTPYLKKEIMRRQLTEPLACGRIYKVVPKKGRLKNFTFYNDATKLVALLGHANGWVRDRAQQILVDGKNKEAIPALEKAIRQTGQPLLAIHALWTLEGLQLLQTSDVLALLKQTAWPVKMQALSVLPSVVTIDNYKQYLAALQQIADGNDRQAAPYVAFLTGIFRPFDKIAANDLLINIAKKYPDDKYVADAVISNLEAMEQAFKEQLVALVPDTNTVIHKELKSLLADLQEKAKNKDPLFVEKEFPRGAAIFKSSCQTCHGANGEGIRSIAPPLNKSEWVNGNKDRLTAIVLFGLTGPIQVNGHLYKAPEIAGAMPGVAYNKELSDSDLAQLFSFIRQSWQNTGGKIQEKDVAGVRAMFKNRQKALTMDELNRLYN